MASLVSERLLIRSFRKTDWQDLYEMLSDKEVVKYEPYPVQTKKQCQQAACLRESSAEFYAVCLKTTGKLIGNVYLAPQSHQNWELGYVFNRAYQKKGYGTEAVQILLSWVFSEEKAQRVFAECNPENIASWRLLERSGFYREGHLRKNIYFFFDDAGAPLWQDTFIYGLLKEDWLTWEQIIADEI